MTVCDNFPDSLGRAGLPIAGLASRLLRGLASGTALIELGTDGQPRVESWNSLQDHARTVQLGLLLVAVAGLALWRPRIFSRTAA